MITIYRQKVVGLSILLSLFVFLLLPVAYLLPPTYAITDPLAVSNNKFGIHILSPTPEEASAAAQLVNNNGDWGYVTVLIEETDLDPKNIDNSLNKWQTFFNQLQKLHLIPLVRIATEAQNSYWKTPDSNTATNWADFLNKLDWPVKNRYVIIYNEPNQAKEWGNNVDPASYAQILNQTIDALKAKSPDFFVMNAGFDASAPEQPPNYMDEAVFLQEMAEAVPGIFNKLDGWASHSYPNPGFVGSPSATGRGTVETWVWELQQLKDLGLNKTLPVFITETGWKHADGITYDSSLPTAETIANYFKIAFANAWSSNQVIAVTPFLLSYQQPPFDHFSFEKVTSESPDSQVLGIQYPASEDSPYYAHYLALKDMPKVKGNPVQVNKADLVQGSIYQSIAVGETYTVNLTFENTGESIWGDAAPVKLGIIYGGKELNIKDIPLPPGKTVAPGEQYTFPIVLTGLNVGDYKVTLNLFSGDKPFQSQNFDFTTEVKSPVILVVKAELKWQNLFAGEYSLEIKNGKDIVQNNIMLDENGVSQQIKNNVLLPDYSFDFTLKKSNYQSKTVTQQVHSGVNTINFGILEPDLVSILFNPKELWDLLSFSK